MLYPAYALTFAVVAGVHLDIVVINCGSTDLCNPACNVASSDFV